MAGDPTVTIPFPLFLIMTAAIILFLVFFLLQIFKKRVPHILENINNRLDQLEKIGADFNKISNLFMVPHVRGGLGETILNELLGTWLPAKAFALQFPFRDGSRVDAVVRIGNYIVPIDAKFPLERITEIFNKNEEPGKVPPAVRRTFLKYADDICRKYIKPDEGTLDFALMYIPSEKVFYSTFILETGELLTECLHRGVVPVSPSGLFLYLQTVSFGFRGFSLPEKQKVLLRLIYQLRKDFSLFAKSYTLAGNHLKNLAAAYEESVLRMGRVETNLDNLEKTDSDNKDLN